MTFYKIALTGILKKPFFGTGSFQNSDYYSDLSEAGFGHEAAMGDLGGIHNGFLYISYLNGIVVGIIFILFLIAAFVKYWELGERNPIFILISFSVLEIIIAGLSNAILISSEIGLLFSIILGMGAAIENKSSDKILANV